MLDYSKEFKAIVEAYQAVGGDRKALLDSRNGSIIIDGNTVLGKNEVAGIHMEISPIDNGIKLRVKVDDGAVIGTPVHLCFGMLPKEGRQVINSEFFIGKGAKVNFLEHCSFPNAEHIEHVMDSVVHLAEDAEMSYKATHFHSDSGGTQVYPRLRGEIGIGGRLKEEFKLVNGRVGILDIDYEMDLERNSICELETKIYGKADDRIDVKESLHLNGEGAAGNAKSRIVLIDRAIGNVLGEVEGNAPYTRGHIDCHEVVHGEGARASSTPRISVEDPLARVTHEAAIGRISRKELETLMSRGLEEEEAVDMIVTGLLR